MPLSLKQSKKTLEPMRICPNISASLPHRVLRTAALLVLIAVLGACATAGGGKSVHSSLTPIDGEPRGWLVATIGVLGEQDKLPPFHGNYVNFRPVPEQGRATGTFYAYINDVVNAPREELDVFEGGKLQKVIVIPLRPGQYEITGGDMVTDVGVATASDRSAPGFSHPFEIRADQFTYVGSYLARVMMGENAVGMTIRSGAYYEISDQQQRDLALARARDPSLPKDAPVADAIPRPPQLAAGMFLFVE